MKIGDKVAQVQKGGIRTGTVVGAFQDGSYAGSFEKNADRLRVLWFHPNGTPDKRTWVAKKFLTVTA